MAGLATPIRKDNDLLSATRRAFGKLDRPPLPLEKRLEALSETELQVVLQTAQMVKMAHQFGNNKTRPYKELVRSMYGKLPYSMPSLISDVLQDAEPIDAKPTSTKSRDELTLEVLDSYKEVS